mgnify:CR=1 FL=1
MSESILCISYCPRFKFITYYYSNFRDVKADNKSDNALVFPSVHLKSSVKIVSGDGSSSNPFTLSL